MKKLIFALMFILTFALISSAADWPTVQLLYPVGGEVFHPGQKVTIKWKVDNPHLIPVCEQDIYLVMGQYQYLIRQTGPDERSFNWIVPNVSGRSVLQTNVGCEQGKHTYESWTLQTDHAFTIASLD